MGKASELFMLDLKLKMEGRIIVPPESPIGLSIKERLDWFYQILKCKESRISPTLSSMYPRIHTPISIYIIQLLFEICKT